MILDGRMWSGQSGAFERTQGTAAALPPHLRLQMSLPPDGDGGTTAATQLFEATQEGC